MIIKFDDYINEGVRDKMTPKSTEEIEKQFLKNSTVGHREEIIKEIEDVPEGYNDLPKKNHLIAALTRRYSDMFMNQYLYTVINHRDKGQELYDKFMDGYDIMFYRARKNEISTTDDITNLMKPLGWELFGYVWNDVNKYYVYCEFIFTKKFNKVNESIRDQMTPRPMGDVTDSVINTILRDYTEHSVYFTNRGRFGLNKLNIAHHTGDGFMNSVNKKFGKGLYLHVDDDSGDLTRKYLHNLDIDYTPIMSTTYRILSHDKIRRLIKKFVEEVINDNLPMMMIRKFDN